VQFIESKSNFNQIQQRMKTFSCQSAALAMVPDVHVVVQAHGYEFAPGSGYALPEYPFVRPPELRLPVAGASSHIAPYPIVIVGGGLTGLTLACALAQLGQSAVLLDEDNTVGVKGASSRGICYTQKSLEIFERLGIYKRIAAKGVQWSVGRTFAGNDEVYAFDLKAQGDFNLSSQPPFINIQQFYIEGFLVERIAELNAQCAQPPQASSQPVGVELRWRSRLLGFEQHESYASLRVGTPEGEYSLRALHVIDATGAGSPLRKWLQVPATAKRGDDRWCIADVRFSHHPPQERHTWIEAPFNENRAVWQHLMADDVWRIDYQMAPGSDPAEVSREEVVRERLAQQFGAEAQVSLVWVGPYAYRSECVDTMRHGRVFFVGDAAKVVSPFGARGGNTGVADADNLAWKLAAVVAGRAAPALLDSFHQERHQAVLENVRVTNRTARFLRPSDGVERLFRSAAIGLAKQYPFARALINTGRMAVANRYTQSAACSAGGGVSVQNVGFVWANGEPAGLNDLLRWAHGRLLLIVFGALSTAALQHLRQLTQAAPLLAVQVVSKASQMQSVECVLDVDLCLQRACQGSGVDLPQWALVRPDAYLAATGPRVNARLLQALQKALGL
jgi:3-(3-hydroxy-phenyl)propionate hydroxylase